MEPEDHPIYRAGRAARLSGELLEACPYSTTERLDLYSLWLAGFNDADLELTE